MKSIAGIALRFCLALAIGGTMIHVPDARAGAAAKVTNGNDAGPGSLRAALESQATRIEIDRSVGAIEIHSTLEYSGQDRLQIKGRGQTVSIDSNMTLLAITRGADLKISDLNFEGPGGFSILNRGDLDPLRAAGKGIFVGLREDQTGTVKIDLRRVKVSGVANHGIHVSDCSLADDCGSGGGGGGDGSPASIMVKLDRVTVTDVGNGKFDADGLRVDERGDGDIELKVKRSSFTYVGADGVELDEGNNGDVVVDVKDSDFSDNGNYCDPDVVGPFLPAVDEAEFDDLTAVDSGDLPQPPPAPGVVVIPGPVFGSPDDGCLERSVDFYDSGYVEEYEIAIDLDDGFDIDEAGDGSLIAKVKDSTIRRNQDEGLDFDEEDAGLVAIDLDRTEASANRDDGFKISEVGDGTVIGRLKRITSIDNGGKGIVFEEEDSGDLFLKIESTRTSNNDDSDDTGIEAVQESPGIGKLRLKKSNIADGIDLDGVEEI
ncbi:MAG: hypothetical protein PVJ78_13675 [Gammaproteobacteria bacterium]|jgi:hypothetical protein